MVNGSNPTTGPEEPSSNNDTNFYTYRQRKKSSGLSTGGIIAIVIPLSVVLISISIISLMCSKRNTSNPKMIIDSNSGII